MLMPLLLPIMSPLRRCVSYRDSLKVSERASSFFDTP